LRKPKVNKEVGCLRHPGTSTISSHQYFYQTVPLQESHVVTGHGPQKNERTKLALSFNKLLNSIIDPNQLLCFPGYPEKGFFPSIAFNLLSLEKG